MFIKYIMRLFILAFLLPLATAYHATNDLLRRVEAECRDVDVLSCTWENDMLIVDWNKDKPRDVLWTFNEHARERVTGELALHMIRQLKVIRPTRRITIIPVVNIWGRKRVEAGDTCRRKNQHGVDTNRNYPVHRRHYPLKSEEYEGGTPLSEPQTQYIAAVLHNHTRMFINIHSGEFSIYSGWDSTYHLPPNHNRLFHNIETWAKQCPTCATGSAAVASTYLAYGTAVDYATSLGIDAYTFEIFGGDHDTCEHMFNPSPKELPHILEQWSHILQNTLQ